jgi:hypothetical protein
VLRIPDLVFYPSRSLDTGSGIPDLRSRIPDLTTTPKEEGDNKVVLGTFFVATNVKKLKIILFLNRNRKNNLSQWTKN